MTIRARVLLASLLLAPALAVLPACVDGAPDLGPEIVVTDHVPGAPHPPHAPAPALAGEDRLGVAQPPAPDAPGDAIPAVCGCTDQACIDAWVEDTLGCGVCVHVRCGDGPAVAACVACPVEPAP